MAVGATQSQPVPQVQLLTTTSIAITTLHQASQKVCPPPHSPLLSPHGRSQVPTAQRGLLFAPAALNISITRVEATDATTPAYLSHPTQK